MQKVMSEADQCQVLADLLAPETWPPDTSALDTGVFSGAYQELAEMLKIGAIKPDIMAKAKKRGILDKILQANTAINPEQAKAARLASRWQLIPAAELMQPAKPPVYLLHGMIRKPALICFYGPPGNLKTMLAYDMAVCVAAGLPWLPHLPAEPGAGGGYTVNSGPALILDLDNGRDRLQERMGALSRGRGLTEPPPFTAISLPNPPLNLATPEDTANVIDQAKALQASLIIIDNLGTASGGADENSAEMIAVMANLRFIAESTGAVLIPIHHTRKGLSNGGREGDRLRGHSSIEAALDLALLIEREGNDITVKSTKTRDNPIKPFIARWTYEANQWGALEWARLWHVADVQPDMPEYQRLALKVPDILAELEPGPSQTKLAAAISEASGVTKPTALQAIRAAVKSGAIIETVTGTGQTAPKTYRKAGS